jgi:uncharacterized protein YcbX
MLGERMNTATVTADGLLGDRQFALFDRTTGLGLTARRVPDLLFARARLRPNGSVEITLPDGSIAPGDHALSEWLGRPVTLRPASSEGPRRYENPDNIDAEADSPWTTFTGAGGAFHDVAAARVSILSLTTMQGWDPRRFRTNIYVDGSDEDSLVGSDITIGEAILHVNTRIQRCVMTTRPQADGLPRDLDVLRTIRADRSGMLAVGATVVKHGIITVGDLIHRSGGSHCSRE